MNEFNFRVANAAPRASGFEIGQNVGDTKTTYIYSYKTKYINGKSTGQKTNVDWDTESSSIPSWVSVKYVFEGNDCKVTFTTLQENTGSSARTHTLVMKQRESGETISFPISQQPNFTYTYFLEVSDVSSTVGANIGATTTIMVQSYMTRSDGEKMAKQPSVGATPSFASKVTVKDGSVMAGAPHWYQIVVEATAANIGSSERSETLLVTCGDQRKEVTIWQKAAEPYITLTLHWPLNTDSAAFFKEGQIPQSDSTGGTVYFSINILDNTSVHRYKKSKGIIVNLRDGNTEIAYPGDRISAYIFTNQAWKFRSTFILPSSDQSITL
jgi:hypothetical protein